MPELPEVETVRRGLAPALEGARVLRVEQRRPDLRFPFPPDFARRLTGRRVLGLRRRAKYLLADLDSGETLVMHLGMSGSFRVDGDLPGLFHHPRDKSAAHDHVVFHIENGASVTYNDPRRFGFMLLVPTGEVDRHKLFDGLGIEPLGAALDAAFLARAFRGRTAPAKALLLDQRLIAGLGNIYVCEALHRAGISPLAQGGRLVTAAGRPTAALARLPDAIREVLAAALAAGGSSLRDHRQADGSLGYFQHSFRVYDREGAACPTPGCGGTIRRVVQSGRSTFYCPDCQKPRP
ncbi:bifunctional DNA-formamidopyrimidine glycosylase/DNA-(apurinic or apyrimidinic site) lyase [Methylocystis echinoides]|uniref:Formamidopyrimidine-DNA glycosylase n=1 Tax=Methylocystis echinoides TaxID=29468 RepID=A0A9W6GR62_9HYPH|nr:bifunctional DNA-formamidopyrimidine glycosylase/DNA-(apurinic or apyrimidinic site) lyase [Methylocystis echinoides]GLI91577.1 formamidopyrimidine-DNA glycosylase [Methylocystis echinoides]